MTPILEIRTTICKNMVIPYRMLVDLQRCLSSSIPGGPSCQDHQFQHERQWCADYGQFTV
jgi:hypothetical protein